MPDLEPFAPHEFLQDFLEEAGEHLLSIRQKLLALEASLEEVALVPEAAVQRVPLINELFRSMHTLKGLCGMVGLAAGEELSHQMESVLGGVKRMEVDISLPLIDALLSATQTLEAVIAPLHEPSLTAPPISQDKERLAALLTAASPAGSGQPPAPTAGEDPTHAAGRSTAAFLEPVQAAYPDLIGALSSIELSQLEAAYQAGKYLFLAVFTPTPEKAERSETVNQARQQIIDQVELVKSMPLIGSNGIRFGFCGYAGEVPEPGRFIDMEWIHITPLTARPANAPVEPSADRPAPFSTAVRVDLAQLDEMMHLVGDLVVQRSRLLALLPQLSGAASQTRHILEQTVEQMGRSLGDLRQGIMRTRMVPLAEVFNYMPLAVRDLARALGKEVRLEMSGEYTQIDKQLVDRLLDPLMHLVRNAITHGIETPAERQRQGKRAAGSLTLRGQPEGDHILVTVADDGAGVDLEAVAAKAASLGWIEPGQTLTNADVLDILCRPGFTTRAHADLGSGRGLGMEIVTQFIHAVGGSISLQSTPGQGAAFTLRLPLSLTIVDALIVRAGAECYAIQQSAVEVALEIDPALIVPLDTREIYPYHDGALTLFRLDRLLGLPSRRKDAQPLYALVSAEGEARTALVVDRLVGLREVVVRTITDPLVAQPGIIGATELGDGSVILILDLNVHLYAARAG